MKPSKNVFIFYALFIALSIQNGTTVAGHEDGTAGSANNALNWPMGLALGIDSSVYVCDNNNNRVMHFGNGLTMGIQVAGSTTSGTSNNQLKRPVAIYVDTKSNIYVGDHMNYRVMLWNNGSSSGTRVAGTGSSGGNLYTLSGTYGVSVDSYGNVYVLDPSNNRVVRWSPNATIGTLVAGGNGQGSNSNHFNIPSEFYLDELHSHLYIADSNNHRIQRVTLDGSMNTITVAGGNGPGTNSNQLNYPVGVYFSKNTNAIYIAEELNYRITRWYIGATSGVIIAGKNGQSGISPMLLYHPTHITVSSNETFLYIADTYNNRVQRFQLI